MQVYEGIYDVVADNLEKAGRKFAYGKSTFLSDVANHPQIVDISRYELLKNPQYFQAVYVAVYRRLPEKKTERAWRNRYGMRTEEFRRVLLKEVVNSSVVAINHIQFINNPYFEQRRGIRYRLFGLLYGLTDKSSLREFGKKLPVPVQNIIRKVFL